MPTEIWRSDLRGEKASAAFQACDVGRSAFGPRGTTRLMDDGVTARELGALRKSRRDEMPQSNQTSDTDGYIVNQNRPTRLPHLFCSLSGWRNRYFESQSPPNLAVGLFEAVHQVKRPQT